jgi:hypothetical protein
MRILSVLFAALTVLGCATQPPPAAPAAKAPAPTGWNPLDPAKLCAGVQDPVLCARLLDMNNKEQIARRKWLADRDNKEIQAEVERIDAANFAELAAIIDRHGWPGRSLVGGRASGGAWGVIQHAPIESIKKYLPVMTQAMKSGELDGALVATSVDRVLVADGKPQTYGTQFREENGEMVPFPIEDPAGVDARRAEVGLQPLAEYKVLMNQMYKKKP